MREKILAVLNQHVPQAAVPYCYNLWETNSFTLKITKSRYSKAGDFSCASSFSTPIITLNNDLNPYLFLTTYIHEVAHLHIFKKYSRKVNPHGNEWKKCFQELMLPVLTPEYFPEDLLLVLKKHMLKPMASSFADADLTKAFRKYDPKVTHLLTVSDLPEGTHFTLRGRHFKKGELKRTRFVCNELKSKRKYLVPAEALVDEVQLRMF